MNPDNVDWNKPAHNHDADFFYIRERVGWFVNDVQKKDLTILELKATQKLLNNYLANIDVRQNDSILLGDKEQLKNQINNLLLIIERRLA